LLRQHLPNDAHEPEGSKEKMNMISATLIRGETTSLEKAESLRRRQRIQKKMHLSFLGCANEFSPINSIDKHHSTVSVYRYAAKDLNV
jgi:hypothetical protein